MSFKAEFLAFTALGLCWAEGKFGALLTSRVLVLLCRHELQLSISQSPAWHSLGVLGRCDPRASAGCGLGSAGLIPTQCVLLCFRLDLALLLLAWVSLACHFASLRLLFPSGKRAHLIDCSDGLKVFMVTLLNGFLKSRMTEQTANEYEENSVLWPRSLVLGVHVWLIVSL